MLLGTFGQRQTMRIMVMDFDELLSKGGPVYGAGTCDLLCALFVDFFVLL